MKALSATLWSLAVPGTTPKALRAAVRERHPEASKKDIARAAFYALIQARTQDNQTFETLHRFALAERIPSDEPPITIGKRRKKQRQPNEVAVPEAAETAETAEAAVAA